MISFNSWDVEFEARLAEIGSRVGGTPLLPVRQLFRKQGVEILAKAEWEQLSGSVKVRAAFSIIKHAVESGELHCGKHLLDATSGNTGIAYASSCAALHIPVTLCLPENASETRKQILRTLGVELIYTSPFGGTDEAQEVALDLAAKLPEKYYYADQYKNEYNWRAHYLTTAEEIIAEAPWITHFVAGLGTTGTFTGTGKKLRQLKKEIELVALQPDIALHGLEGWKHLESAATPKIFDASLADRILEVSTEEAHTLIRDAWKFENIRLSPSSAANLAGAIKLAVELDEGTIVTILPDNADKYEEINSHFF
ncbi:MAG: cysteine synthase family protein [Crocinitomicaceae bacterium]|nr:cysteine synthase family protein [Crocinitomicaceae bacterium]